MMHSDIADYLAWGTTVEAINAGVRRDIESEELDVYWDMWARLTGRYQFAGRHGTEVAREMLDVLGGECIVHGHSIIGSLTGLPSEDVTEPVLYAGGLVLAIDGGRYDGGPLLVARLE